MPVARNITKEQAIAWRANCLARASELRVAGDIKRAEGFEEGARGYDLLLNRKRQDAATMRSKAKSVNGFRGRLRIDAVAPRNADWDLVLQAIGDEPISIGQLISKLARSRGSMDSCLRRLIRAGLVEKIGRGIYRCIPEQ